jgi:type II secretory pathway pseudopilin PulG
MNKWETWEVVVAIVVGVVLLLFIFGLAANVRIRRAREKALEEHISAADHALAQARAADRGWDPALLESAARSAFANRRPGVEPDRFDLVQVVDRPGTDEDRARMRITFAAGAEEIELQRTGDTWAAA